MEIRDVVHGAIRLAPEELPIVDCRYFQRLRHIKQTGFGDQSFPSATHSRYSHSLGALATATRSIEAVFEASPIKDWARFRNLVRLSALLHDVGHGPLSHATEFAMPPVSELKVPGTPDSNRQATHEDYTLKIILDSDMTELLNKAGKKDGFGAQHVAALIDPDFEFQDSFFQEAGADFRPLLQQVISSELDADRMDYLRRDSLYSGVSYGQFDYDWLSSNLGFHVHEGRAYMALRHRALYAFEDFLLSRYHMFLMVYFHYKSVVYDEMLMRYFHSKDCTYRLPADLDAYSRCNDGELYESLSKSSNDWAQRIVQRRPFRRLVEVQSGIPAHEDSANKQMELMFEIQSELAKRGVPFLLAKSTGELSKYASKEGHPIFVAYDNHLEDTQFISLRQCTDLFQRYPEKRSITRIYVAPEVHADLRSKLRELRK